jgi:predicted ATPase
MKRISGKIPSVGRIKDRLPDRLRDSPNRLFLYLLMLEDPKPRPLICVETPDNGLYHDMVDVLAAEFREYAVSNPYSQIIFTTHNPYILESMAPQEVWIFKRGIDEAENMVDIMCAGADPVVSEMYDQGVGMGAIWYAGHFDE